MLFTAEASYRRRRKSCTSDCSCPSSERSMAAARHRRRRRRSAPCATRGCLQPAPRCAASAVRLQRARCVPAPWTCRAGGPALLGSLSAQHRSPWWWLVAEVAWNSPGREQATATRRSAPVAADALAPRVSGPNSACRALSSFRQLQSARPLCHVTCKRRSAKPRQQRALFGTLLPARRSTEQRKQVFALKAAPPSRPRCRRRQRQPSLPPAHRRVAAAAAGLAAR